LAVFLLQSAEGRSLRPAWTAQRGGCTACQPLGL